MYESENVDLSSENESHPTEVWQATTSFVQPTQPATEDSDILAATVVKPTEDYFEIDNANQDVVYNVVIDDNNQVTFAGEEKDKTLDTWNSQKFDQLQGLVFQTVEQVEQQNKLLYGMLMAVLILVIAQCLIFSENIEILIFFQILILLNFRACSCGLLVSSATNSEI